MNREQVLENVLNISNNNVLLEFPTGFGKTKSAFNLMDKYKPEKILIAIQKLVHENVWRNEFSKWGYESYLPKVTFVTHVSLHKHINKEYDYVIMDEAHHITEISIWAINKIITPRLLFLSGTVSTEKKFLLNYNIKDLFTYKIYMREAQEAGIIPTPTVYLIPLYLDNTKRIFKTEKNTKAPKKIIVNYKDRWSYMKDKSIHLVLQCTAQEYYEDISSQIEWYKSRWQQMGIVAMRNIWLQTCNRRLSFLSNLKTEFIKELLEHLKNKRVVTLCESIDQATKVCANAMHSKNKKSLELYEAFNAKTFNHLAACDMLNEGANLEDCQYGIYANLNSSDTLVRQRLGRLLRHPEPILIIPYYVNTRDEELKDQMLLKYNAQEIKIISNINEIELC